FIDTPGHEAFANLRKRGGSIADIAILVIDINQGVQPQTVESINLLKQFKTPFVVAATKIDALSGWIKRPGECIGDSLSKQRQDVLQHLDQKIYELVGQLSRQGLSSERFDRVNDFTKELLIIPVSAHTKEGLQELLLYVAGLAQKYLEKRLALHEKEPGKGSILEVKEEKGLGKTIDVILYDGVLSEGAEVAFSTFEGKAVSCKVKAILRPKPLDEMRDPKQKFSRVKLASAATGVKIACEQADKALPGSSLYVLGNKKEVFSKLEKEYSEVVMESEKDGVIVKADALGSLEAIAGIFSTAGIPIRKAAIGAVTKKDIAEAASVSQKNRFLGCIFSFNLPLNKEAEKEMQEREVKLFNENVIYNLLENYQRWVEEEKAAERKNAFEQLMFPGKIKILPGHCFRVSSPLICGIEVLEGRIRKGASLLNANGEEIGTIRNIQREKKEVESASKGEQLAVSISGPTFGRQIKEKQLLFIDVPEGDVKLLETKYASSLTEGEKELLRETKKLKGLRVF
ncbi:translation initiation factor IF-2, partial [Candidatus Micrarchaeota archaeon]|nr:translation initiation factor IF-2 [Candidatus Micrarchaeota archaeon]